MSQKRMKGTPTRAEGMVMTYREALFTIVTAAARVLAVSIDASFDKTRYGSARNNFFKMNYEYFKEWGQNPIFNGGGDFTNALIGSGMSEGQTILAALQSGVINAAELEIAMRASRDELGNYTFMAADWGSNQLQTKYIRVSKDGEFVVNDADQFWEESQTPVKQPTNVTIIGETTGTGNAMTLLNMQVRGDNIQGLATTNAIFQVNSTENLLGTWSADGQVFTLTTPWKVPIGSTNRVTLVFKGIVIAETNIYGSNSQVGE